MRLRHRISSLFVDDKQIFKNKDVELLSLLPLRMFLMPLPIVDVDRNSLDDGSGGKGIGLNEDLRFRLGDDIHDSFVAAALRCQSIVYPISRNAFKRFLYMRRSLGTLAST